jgi:hypothetical protein
MNLNWKRIGRDSLIVFVLTFVGGFLVGLLTGYTGGDPSLYLWISLSNFVLGTAGFAYSWYHARSWKHVFAVAVVVWVISLINVTLAQVTISQWFAGIVPVLIFMALGAGVGGLLHRLR